MERRGRIFTPKHIETIRLRVTTWKNTDEMALLVFLLLETKLKTKDILGWFNKDREKRRLYLKEKDELLAELGSVPLLFPKTHQAYLNQWKVVCKKWFGIQGATFEMLRRSIKANAKKEYHFYEQPAATFI